jgi:uncharacterized protein YkwD
MISRRRLLATGLLGAGLLPLAACNTAPPAGPVPAFYQRLDEGAELDLEAAAGFVNAWRAKKGLGPLALDPALTEQARARAAGVAATDTSTWGEMPKITHVAAGGGKRAERVSAGYRTLAEAFSGWRDSPQHNAVMLAPFGTRMGIAAVDRPGTKYRVYWCLIVAGG